MKKKNRLTLVPKVQEQKPTNNKSGKKPDPNKPGVFSFKHGDEDRTVDLEKLRVLCFNFARAKGWKTEDAEDFAGWAVVANLNRIDNGYTKNGHLNDVPILFKDYLVVHRGIHNPNSKRALAHKKTFYYSNKMNEDGDVFLDLIPDNSVLNPEEALILKETLNERHEEFREALRDKKKENREARAKKAERKAIRLNDEDKLYKFLLSKADCLGRIEKNPKSLAKEYGTTTYDFRNIISRLANKKKINITKQWYILPVAKGEALKRVA